MSRLMCWKYFFDVVTFNSSGDEEFADSEDVPCDFGLVS